jgi:hypothetical protein
MKIKSEIGTQRYAARPQNDPGAASTSAELSYRESG